MISALALLSLNRRRKNDKQIDTWHSGGKGDGTAPQVNGVRYFSLEELQKCTDNFSERNKIGEGTFSVAYKGYLANGILVAIKRARERSLLAAEEFKNEIETLCRVHHKHLVSLIGFCFERGEQMLVFEHISNGSLRDNLDGRLGIYLDWKKRLQIALNSARGLTYLHELANPQIIHTLISSGNILLDENLNAKLTAFGFSKLNHEKPESHVSSQVNQTLMCVETRRVGTVGYADPAEYMNTGQLSEKSDVYSFGVILIDLITGRWPFEYDNRSGETIVLKEQVKTTIDLHDQEYYGLRNLIDPKIVNQARNISLTKFVQLALTCIKDLASDRPSMYEVMKEIEIILLNYEMQEQEVILLV